MLSVIACLVGVFVLLLIAEILGRQKILKGENLRKFVHITVGSFVAFWPWLISWQTIQLIGVAMLVVLFLNRQVKIFNFFGKRQPTDFGDIFLALAIILCALLTTNKIFFAIAILHVALADGLAGVIGKNFGARWRYQVLHHTKTVVGSMTFWIVSLGIMGAGPLFANNIIPFDNYFILLLVVPPILTAIENLSEWGIDNLSVPIAVLIALQAAQSI